MAKAFVNQPEKDSAIALSERVWMLRQGGIKTFQQVLLPAQPGQRAGQAASVGPAVVQRQRLQTGVAAHVQAMKQTLQRGVETAQRVVTAPRAQQEIQRRPSLHL